MEYKVKNDLLHGYVLGQRISKEEKEELNRKGCPEMWFEPVKEELEIGRWGFFEGHNGTYEYLIRITGFDGYYVRGYGFDGEMNDKWFGERLVCPQRNFKRYAKTEEVKELFRREANRREYSVGTTIKEAEFGYKCTIKELNWDYDVNYDDFFVYTSNGHQSIYCQGNWAEIVEEVIEVNGEKVVFTDNTAYPVKVGCRTLSAQFIRELDNVLWNEQVQLLDKFGNDLSKKVRKVKEKLT